jgi:hypothetical protein
MTPFFIGLITFCVVCLGAIAAFYYFSPKSWVAQSVNDYQQSIQVAKEMKKKKKQLARAFELEILEKIRLAQQTHYKNGSLNASDISLRLLYGQHLICIADKYLKDAKHFTETVDAPLYKTEEAWCQDLQNYQRVVYETCLFGEGHSIPTFPCPINWKAEDFYCSKLSSSSISTDE